MTVSEPNGARSTAPEVVHATDRDSFRTDGETSRVAEAAAVIAAARNRISRDGETNEHQSALLTGGSFLVATAIWIALAPPHVPVGALAACVCAYVVAGCVEFEIGPGCAVPTTPIQVVMLFALPPQLVPLAVGLGLVGASLVSRMWDPRRKEHLLVLAGSGWQVLGPAAVFAIAHVSQPALADLPVYAAALAMQLAFDAAASWARYGVGLGIPATQLANALRFTFACDVALAPVGVAAALAVPGSAGALLFVLPLVGLLALLQVDRRRHIDETVTLGAAYSDTSTLARRDPLTGVSNRLAWEEAIARFEVSELPVGVILADVDGLKAANDEHSHAMGDRVLVAVTETLVRAIPPDSNGVAFRIGGDEFGILFPLATRTRTEEIAASMQAAFRAAPALDGSVLVSASIGSGHAAGIGAIGGAIATADRAVGASKASRGLQRR